MKHWRFTIWHANATNIHVMMVISLCSPSFWPQMTGGVTPPEFVTSKVSSRHRDCRVAGMVPVGVAMPNLVMNTLTESMRGPAIANVSKSSRSCKTEILAGTNKPTRTKVCSKRSLSRFDDQLRGVSKLDPQKGVVLRHSPQQRRDSLRRLLESITWQMLVLHLHMVAWQPPEKVPPGLSKYVQFSLDVAPHPIETAMWRNLMSTSIEQGMNPKVVVQHTYKRNRLRIHWRRIPNWCHPCWNTLPKCSTYHYRRLHRRLHWGILRAKPSCQFRIM